MTKSEMQPFQKDILDHINSLSGKEKAIAYQDLVEIVYDDRGGFLFWLAVKFIRFSNRMIYGNH